MTKTTMIAVIAGLSAGAATVNAQDAIAYWAFNDQGLPGGGFGFQTGEFPFGAEFGAQAGSATISLNGGLLNEDGGDGVLDWVQSFAGTTINAQFGEGSGGTLAIQGGTDNGNNGSFIDFDFDGSLLEDIAFSFAARRTSTGFNDVDIDAYSGGVFLGSIAADQLWDGSLALESYDASILDGIADATIRMTFNGVTSSSGNNRFDNFLIEANVIPAPGAVAFLALGGLAARRRRA